MSSISVSQVTTFKKQILINSNVSNVSNVSNESFAN